MYVLKRKAPAKKTKTNKKPSKNTKNKNLKNNVYAVKTEKRFFKY